MGQGHMGKETPYKEQGPHGTGTSGCEGRDPGQQGPPGDKDSRKGLLPAGGCQATCTRLTLKDTFTL